MAPQPPRQKPPKNKPRQSDDRVEQAVKDLLARYPHLQAGEGGERTSEAAERFAKEAIELFKKKVAES